MDEDTIGELLQNISLRKDNREITFGVFVDTKGGLVMRHIVPLHILGVGPFLKTNDSKVPIYVWASDNVLG